MWGRDSEEPRVSLPTLERLADVVELLPRHRQLFVRYSHGPARDTHEQSRDYESGQVLPGLSVADLQPPPWWTRPAADWVARRVCSYGELAQADPNRYAWVLTGRVVDRGPDHEPLVADVRPVARIGPGALAEAADHYERHFAVGKDSTP
jgi:Family of unknown function (DUF6098)